jgi:hypothetical protein
VACRFQLAQRLQAAIPLLVAAHVVEPEVFAQHSRQRASVHVRVCMQHSGDIRNGSRLRQRPLDLILCVHAASMRRNRNIVQH